MVLSPVTTLSRGAESATYRVRIFISKEESATPGASLKLFEAISWANAAAAVEPNAAKPAAAAALSWDALHYVQQARSSLRPFRLGIARSAWAASAISTNAKPRDRAGIVVDNKIDTLDVAVRGQTTQG
jgi:hypothetical protein